MIAGARIFLSLYVAVLLAASPLSAFEVPLSDNSIREAYFLGQRNDQKTSTFLSQYRAAFPVPKAGPYVSQIWLFTPYAQVVRTSGLHTIGYSAQQAAADYRGLGDTVLIEVRIEFTPTFSYGEAQRLADQLAGELHEHLNAEDFWRAFTLRVFQHDTKDERQLERLGIGAESIRGDGGILLGAEVWIEYDAAQFESVPAQVEVVTPSGQRTVTSFDLGKLR